jgi:hypothetical protein
MLAGATQNQALTAMLFLYRDVLGVDLPWLDGLVRAKTAKRLPIYTHLMNNSLAAIRSPVDALCT